MPTQNWRLAVNWFTMHFDVRLKDHFVKSGHLRTIINTLSRKQAFGNLNLATQLSLNVENISINCASEPRLLSTNRDDNLIRIPLDIRLC